MSGKEKIKAFLWIDKVKAFDQNEIIARIPEDILNDIKSKDPNPFFQMYSVAHEGTFTPKLQGKESYPITWTKDAIKSIKNVIKKGIKFFNGHNESIDKPDKQELGEMVHSFEETIDGKLHHVAIGYFPKETREIAKEKDICSQECWWNIAKTGEKAIATLCDSFKGIALESSLYNRPAFNGARRLAAVQAFDINQPSEGDSQNLSEGDSHIMEYQEVLKFSNRDIVKRLIDDLQLHPNQLFDLKGIQTDREYGKYFTELDQLKKDLDTKTKEYEELTKTRDELDRTIKLNTAKDKLITLYKELGYTDNMQKFVNKMYDTNKDNIQDLTDEGLKTFAENQKAIFQMANGEEDKKPDINIPTGDNQPDPENETDFSKAENNSLLKEDYNPDEL